MRIVAPAVVALSLFFISLPGAAVADASDPVQLTLLSNALLTGNYASPAQPQIQRLAIYHGYALVELNQPLPPTPVPSATLSPSSSASSAAPSASPSVSPVASPTATPRLGPSSFVAIKTHRNWVVLFSKTGRYDQGTLVAAGVPKDVAAGLMTFLQPPAPLPSP